MNCPVDTSILTNNACKKVTIHASRMLTIIGRILLRTGIVFRIYCREDTFQLSNQSIFTLFIEHWIGFVKWAATDSNLDQNLFFKDFTSSLPISSSWTTKFRIGLSDSEKLATLQNFCVWSGKGRKLDNFSLLAKKCEQLTGKRIFFGLFYWLFANDSFFFTSRPADLGTKFYDYR